MFYKSKLLLLCSFFTYYFTFKGFAYGRNVMVNLYSPEEQNTFRGSREKRALDIDSYCGKSGCCESRNDECSLPYFRKNATCYCDFFCDQESVGHIDCCPDFWLACNGMDLPKTHATNMPPSTIYPHGSHYEDESIMKENCNYCNCLKNQWICTDHVCLVRADIIEDINAGNFGWKAENYSQFWGLTLEKGFKYRLGTLPPSSALLSMNQMTNRVSPDEEFPLFFIASYKWPEYVHGPLDQKNCAASWAFSTASVAADRIAIHSDGRFTSNLSPQNLISCNVQNGCNGGSIDSAWWFLRKRGLVSHACYPYIMDTNNGYVACNMSSISDKYGKSHATKQCPNHIEDSNYIYQCSPPYRISSDEREIMKEIIENGPVQAVMQVHEDFFLYKTGIYKHTDVLKNKPEEYQMSGTHSVKMIG
ncbi:hypothetical protein FKM82_011136 [Ascaphus truei]